MRIAPSKVLISLCVALSPLAGQPALATSPAEADLVQIEKDWSEAADAGDLDKLNRILADDWTGVTSHGLNKTKQDFIGSVKSKGPTRRSYELGPMSTFVQGDFAVLQFNMTAKSTLNGQTAAVKYTVMDVFIKRNGQWQAVRSLTGKIPEMAEASPKSNRCCRLLASNVAHQER